MLAFFVNKKQRKYDYNEDIALNISYIIENTQILSENTVFVGKGEFHKPLIEKVVHVNFNTEILRERYYFIYLFRLYQRRTVFLGLKSLKRILISIMNPVFGSPWELYL